MADCAFCEDTIVGKSIRRAGLRFCSPECANEYFLTYSDEMDDESGEEEGLVDEFDELDDLGDGREAVAERDYDRYTVDYEEEDEDLF